LTINGGLVSNQTGYIGNVTTGLGAATVSSGTWSSASALIVGRAGTGVLNLTDSGVVTVGAGSGTLTVASDLGSVGTLNIGTGGTAGALNAAAITGGGGTATVNLNHTGTKTVAARLEGSLAVNKNAAGTSILTGSNSYTGGTVINSGTLAAGHNNALGTGEVTVNAGTLSILTGFTATNQITLAGGTLQKNLASGASMADAIKATSQFAGGQADTTATLLVGTTSGATVLTATFSATSGGSNSELLRSDVLHLSGVPIVSGQTTDLFVLELSMTSVAPGSYLGWLNGSNLWVNAALGNTGNNASLAQQGYNGSFTAFQTAYGNTLASYVGAWGFTNTRVWGVLNHNSDFGAVPEPSTAALLLLGAGALLFRRTRKTNT